jgi:hypothetical protein
VLQGRRDLLELGELLSLGLARERTGQAPRGREDTCLHPEVEQATVIPSLRSRGETGLHPEVEQTTVISSLRSRGETGLHPQVEQTTVILSLRSRGETGLHPQVEQTTVILSLRSRRRIALTLQRLDPIPRALDALEMTWSPPGKLAWQRAGHATIPA